MRAGPEGQMPHGRERRPRFEDELGTPAAMAGGDGAFHSRKGCELFTVSQLLSWMW